MLTHFVKINDLDALHSFKVNWKLINTLKFANFSLNNISKLTGSIRTILQEVKTTINQSQHLFNNSKT